jgi:hypothetical protein
VHTKSATPVALVAGLTLPGLRTGWDIVKDRYKTQRKTMQVRTVKEKKELPPPIGRGTAETSVW